MIKTTNKQTRFFSPRLVLGGLGLALLNGCAAVKQPDPQDPWESYNRTMYRINDTVDQAVVKPITLAYTELTPQPAQTCIRNIFNNVGDVWSAANSFLQARGHDFFNTLGRVLFNTTMGLGGCIDVASKNGAPRIPNDFGITLGVWGLKSGPYVVLPVLGPSTLRDASATVGTFAAGVSPTTPIFAIDTIPVRNTVLGLYAIDTRAKLLETDRLIEDIALDPYSFVRDAYLQRRQSQIRQRKQGAGDLSDYADDGLPDYEDYDEYEDDLPDYDDVLSPALESAHAWHTLCQGFAVMQLLHY